MLRDALHPRSFRSIVATCTGFPGSKILSHTSICIFCAAIVHRSTGEDLYHAWNVPSAINSLRSVYLLLGILCRLISPTAHSNFKIWGWGLGGGWGWVALGMRCFGRSCTFVLAAEFVLHCVWVVDSWTRGLKTQRLWVVQSVVVIPFSDEHVNPSLRRWNACWTLWLVELKMPCFRAAEHVIALIACHCILRCRSSFSMRSNI